MLVSQYSSKKNRVLYPESIEFGQDCIEVYRLRDYREHIFNRAQSLHAEMLDFNLFKKWQVNSSLGFCYSQMTPCIVVVDLETVGQDNSEWKEISIDYELLNKIGHHECHRVAQDLPILATKRHV